jgi:hypothetical protein
VDSTWCSSCVAGEAGVFAEVLDAADVLVLGRGFGLLHLGALDDRAGEGIDLAHSAQPFLSAENGRLEK